MKKWENPEVINLKLASTQDDIATTDFPDYWACNGCGKQYVSLFEPKGACERCGSTDGYTWTRGNGAAVTLPNFNGGPVADAPTPIS
ncbi:hypothetical protein [Turicibacter sanguinis]|uniref:hypothetical protein n=1 Tax=Turicibacter sanguinis TaxID=154288 RepID=UPI0018AABB3F|nr:hypothetical protein [Turicibacter sanguinis]MDB8558245.1 hypothetical protein [Turicibacter sanguinis]MDB8561021.1 hypothetical protein [Turicibacter sanguinis]